MKNIHSKYIIVIYSRSVARFNLIVTCLKYYIIIIYVPPVNTMAHGLLYSIKKMCGSGFKYYLTIKERFMKKIEAIIKPFTSEMVMPVTPILFRASLTSSSLTKFIWKPSKTYRPLDDRSNSSPLRPSVAPSKRSRMPTPCRNIP